LEGRLTGVGFKQP